MCYAGKCFYCIKVETGSMIFAVINMVITSLLIIGIIIGTIIFNVTLYKAQHPTDVAILDNVYQYMDKGSQNSRDVLIINAILGGSVFIIILHFAFSAVLINGLSKKFTMFPSCLNCVKVETGSVIFTIINYIFYALYTVSYAALFVFAYVTLRQPEHRGNNEYVCIVALLIFILFQFYLFIHLMTLHCFYFLYNSTNSLGQRTRVQRIF
ncbi:uncharacterized protein LOC113510204 isoform X1 [Galleria mellonella]|uniref:Uncharacterized protein LOC113510204 isoform X1 n=1 Tax=Galleria mellonella TaxID=7137 RepID=A0ABM3MHD3_GALME|nr:uncharacterized protein LOC113510204 isoform X1 [Galleria mellonella]XP_052750541.1 uncharacterized protein LOC113510204 isoform X1 [Galleria mellonella]